MVRQKLRSCSKTIRFATASFSNTSEVDYRGYVSEGIVGYVLSMEVIAYTPREPEARLRNTSNIRILRIRDIIQLKP